MSETRYYTYDRTCLSFFTVVDGKTLHHTHHDPNGLECTSIVIGPSAIELTPERVQSIRDGWSKPSPTPDAREEENASAKLAASMECLEEMTRPDGSMADQAVNHYILTALKAYKSANP